MRHAVAVFFLFWWLGGWSGRFIIATFSWGFYAHWNATTKIFQFSTRCQESQFCHTHFSLKCRRAHLSCLIVQTDIQRVQIQAAH